MGYKPIARQLALDIGIGVHIALGEFYNIAGHIVDPVSVFRNWVAEEVEKCDSDDDIAVLMEAKTMGEAILEGYVKHWKDEDLEVLATEKTLSRTLPGEGNEDWKIEARVDTIVRSRQDTRNRAYILEHKTYTQVDEDQLQRDHQFVAQVWLAKPKTEIPIVGILWNGLRKQIPSPKVKNPLFDRKFVPIKPDAIKLFLRRCREMKRQQTGETLSIYPEPGSMKCRFCSFKQPCLEKMRGGDFQFLLDNLFTTREERAVG